MRFDLCPLVLLERALFVSSLDTGRLCFVCTADCCYTLLLSGNLSYCFHIRFVSNAFGNNVM